MEIGANLGAVASLVILILQHGVVALGGLSRHFHAFEANPPSAGRGPKTVVDLSTTVTRPAAVPC